jgi:Flp pilus assembly pilin Flp
MGFPLFIDEDGVSAMEYGLLAALIAVALVFVLTVLGLSLRDVFAIFEHWQSP